MKKETMKKLKVFEEYASELQTKTVVKDYWEKENNFLEKIRKQVTRESELISMSSKNFHRTFSL